MVRRKSEEKYRGKVIDKNRISIPCSFEPHIINYGNREVYTLSLEKELRVMTQENLEDYLSKRADNPDNLRVAHTKINPAFFSGNRLNLKLNLYPLALREAGLGFGDYVDISDKGDYIEIRKSSGCQEL